MGNPGKLFSRHTMSESEAADLGSLVSARQQNNHEGDKQGAVLVLQVPAVRH